VILERLIGKFIQNLGSGSKNDGGSATTTAPASGDSQ
jgi:hypothetical protein